MAQQHSIRSPSKVNSFGHQSLFHGLQTSYDHRRPPSKVDTEHFSISLRQLQDHTNDTEYITYCILYTTLSGTYHYKLILTLPNSPSKKHPVVSYFLRCVFKCLADLTIL